MGVALEEQSEESYEEAAEVDAEYEYLLKNKDKGDGVNPSE